MVRKMAHLEDGGSATGYGTEVRASFEDFVERAETRSVGRCLALLGFGTPFVGEELSEGAHVADTPVTEDRPSTPSPVPVGEHSSSGTTERPTEAHISALTALALKDCSEEKEVFETRLRRTMGVPAQASVAPKLLTRAMTMAQYMTVFEHYTRLKMQLARKTPEASAHEPIAPQAPSPESTPAPTGETPAAVHSGGGSSSAPDPDAVDEATQAQQRADALAWAKLRREAIELWQIAEKEVDHVLAHHPLAAARNILWRARRGEHTPVVTSASAAA
jgi:hypothetical protein